MAAPYYAATGHKDPSQTARVSLEVATAVYELWHPNQTPYSRAVTLPHDIVEEVQLAFTRAGFSGEVGLEEALEKAPQLRGKLL